MSSTLILHIKPDFKRRVVQYPSCRIMQFDPILFIGGVAVVPSELRYCSYVFPRRAYLRARAAALFLIRSNPGLRFTLDPLEPVPKKRRVKPSGIYY